MSSESADIENVVIKLGLITTQEDGSTDVVLYCRIPCRALDLTDRNGTAAVISLKKSAILMLKDNDRENDRNSIDDINSGVELTYNDIDNDQIEIMTNDDIIDSLKCCSTKKDNNEMMSIKIFAKVSKVLLSQQKQQLHLLPSYEEISDMAGGKWQSDKYTHQRREMIHHIVELLKKYHKDNNSSESTSKIPQMAKQLEVSLYRDAPSFEAYTDMSTLKQRLQPYIQLSSSSESIDIVDFQDLVEVSDMVVIEDKQCVQDRCYHETMNPDSSNTVASSRNSEEWKLRIRHKQQRLLLLNHSAKCLHESNCPVTQHCAQMKRLWSHMVVCKDNACHVPHCFSSRAILSHYRKCKDTNCPACRPVRETVLKSRNISSSRTPGNSSRTLMDKIRGSTSPS